LEEISRFFPNFLRLFATYSGCDGRAGKAGKQRTPEGAGREKAAKASESEPDERRGGDRFPRNANRRRARKLDGGGRSVDGSGESF